MKSLKVLPLMQTWVAPFYDAAEKCRDALPPTRICIYVWKKLIEEYIPLTDIWGTPQALICDSKTS